MPTWMFLSLLWWWLLFHIILNINIKLLLLLLLPLYQIHRHRLWFPKQKFVCFRKGHFLGVDLVSLLIYDFLSPTNSNFIQATTHIKLSLLFKTQRMLFKYDTFITFSYILLVNWSFKPFSMLECTFYMV